MTKHSWFFKWHYILIQYSGGVNVLFNVLGKAVYFVYIISNSFRVIHCRICFPNICIFLAYFVLSVITKLKCFKLAFLYRRNCRIDFGKMNVIKSGKLWKWMRYLRKLDRQKLLYIYIYIYQEHSFYAWKVSENTFNLELRYIF